MTKYSLSIGLIALAILVLLLVGGLYLFLSEKPYQTPGTEIDRASEVIEATPTLTASPTVVP